jgi:hypothetical protein
MSDPVKPPVPDQGQPQPQTGADGTPVVPGEQKTPDEQNDREVRMNDLQEELARLRGEAMKGEKILLKVWPPHSSMTHGGVTVGSEPTEVPAHMVSAVMTAAEEAGVKITQEK